MGARLPGEARHVTPFLHLGCGGHQLPYPWQNYDREVDLRNRLPFAPGSARFIFAEHVIEHLSFADGFRFLCECRRVLAHDGVLRFSFPDITRFTPRHVASFSFYLAKQGVPGVDTLADVQRALLTEWGHQSCWTVHMAAAVCSAAGFPKTRTPYYLQSVCPELRDIDGHHLTTGDIAMTRRETGVVEAFG
jgi:hypothetical protein